MIRKNLVILLIIILFLSSLTFYFITLNGNKSKKNQINNFDIDSINISEIENSFNLSKNWLISNLKDKGCFNYSYNPSEEEYSSKNNMIRQLMASRVLADMSRTDIDLRDLHQRNLDFIFDYWYKENDDIGYIYFSSKSKLGAMAMALRTLVFSPFFDYYVNEAEKLVNCILYLQKDDGSFRAWYIEPPYSYDEDYLLTFYSGEAILSLVDFYLMTGNESVLDAAILSQDYYVDLYVDNLTDNYYPAYVPWHTQSLNKIYKITKNEVYSEAVFVLNDKLLEIQDTINNETLGRFYNSSTPEYGSPHSSSDGVYTEGLVYAYEIAELIGDNYHMDLYYDAIALGVYNLMNLQYTYNNTNNFVFPERIIGAFRYNKDDDRIRIDTTQHTMDAYMKIFEIFG